MKDDLSRIAASLILNIGNISTGRNCLEEIVKGTIIGLEELKECYSKTTEDIYDLDVVIRTLHKTYLGEK